MWMGDTQKVESNNKLLTSQPKDAPRIKRDLLTARAMIKTNVLINASSQATDRKALQQVCDNILHLTDICTDSYKSTSYNAVASSIERYSLLTPLPPQETKGDFAPITDGAQPQDHPPAEFKHYRDSFW